MIDEALDMEDPDTADLFTDISRANSTWLWKVESLERCADLTADRCLGIAAVVRSDGCALCLGCDGFSNGDCPCLPGIGGQRARQLAGRDGAVSIMLSGSSAST